MLRYPDLAGLVPTAALLALACSAGNGLAPERSEVGGPAGSAGSSGAVGAGAAPTDLIEAGVGGGTPQSDAGIGTAPPGEMEICDDGLDNDQDGRVDDGCSCTVGSVQSCWPGDPADRGVDMCADGEQVCEVSGEFSEWGECLGAVLPDEETGCTPPVLEVQCKGGVFTLQGNVQVLASRGAGSSGNSCTPNVGLNFSGNLPDGPPSTNTLSWSGGIFQEFDAQNCDRGRFHLETVEIACFTDRYELRKLHIKYDSGCYSCSNSGFQHMDDFVWDASTGSGACAPQPDGSLLCTGNGQNGNMTLQNVHFSVK